MILHTHVAMVRLVKRETEIILSYRIGVMDQKLFRHGDYYLLLQYKHDKRRCPTTTNINMLRSRASHISPSILPLFHSLPLSLSLSLSLSSQSDRYP